MAIDIHWICDNDSLGQHCAEWQQLPFVALDTEFMRVDTFYPIAGLLQVGDGQRAYLIDPLEVKDWAPFAELLEDPAVTKVLHSCSEDLEVFLRLTGALPAPLFDTQLAAGYLNIGFSMGYSRLVQTVLGIELPKGETRSDWLQRPLSDTQVSYAAEDAQHLAELYQVLLPKLSADKLAWILEDGAELVANLRREIDPDEAYLEAKLAWKLSPQQLAVLRALCAWRERQARARNQPRNRVLREHSLWPLARFQPDNTVALARIEEEKLGFRQAGVAYTRPWLFLMSDGQPTDNWQGAAQRCREAELANKVAVFPIAVGASAKVDALGQFSARGDAAVKRLDGLKFQELFLWLSASMKVVSQARPGGQAQLPAVDGWANVEV